MVHARPHLEVHSRGKGHSALAGVAYRLGLRLYDRRTGVWHDYRKRLVREEIIRALTIAPPGAPAWASDPDELWARAEAAEKRKDAAIARDYRIPLPLGLSDTAAGDMAEAMAHYIVDRLSVPVSIGVHRDNTADAIGEAKPPEKVGAHAHLYFPTRSLDQMVGEDGTTEWVFGPKLVLLASKREGSAFVDQLNEHWALLANQFTQEAGLVSDYDHRSYKRMGLDVTPQPKLGAGVVAMERKGFFTGRGDALRDIMLPSRLYEATHTVLLAEQQARAQGDVVREATASPTPSLAATPQTISEASAQGAAAATNGPALPEGAPGSLLWRFRHAVALPEDPDALRVYMQVVDIIRLVERLLSKLTDLMHRRANHDEDRSRRVMARLDTEFQIDQARRRRSAAGDSLKQWEEEHPLRMAAAKAAGRMPSEWMVRNATIRQEDIKVQEAKAARQWHMGHMAGIDQLSSQLAGQEGAQKNELSRALDGIQRLSPILLGKLLSVSEQGEATWLEAARPLGAIETIVPVALSSDPIEDQRKLRPRPQ